MTFLMSAGRDCVRAWESMPWVLQNSASQKQRVWLKSHLAHCESCRAEFAQQNRLQRAMSLPSDIAVDANTGLKHLLSRLDAPGQEEVRFSSRSRSRLSHALIAMVLIQALGIGALGMKLWSVGERPPYRTLSQAPLQTPLPATPGAIRVVPDAAMTLADWNALLHALHLQVMGGPNSVGAYTVAPTSSTSTAHALQQLRATRGIRLAEPVATMP
jgi:hypothetical protein